MNFFDTRPKLEVCIVRSNETYACAGDETLLTGMLRLGRRGIPAGCTQGGCGVCKIKIITGSYRLLGPVSRAHVSIEEERQGYTLACRAAPNTAIRLDVAGKMSKPFSRGQAAAAPPTPPDR
jgi:ferredoxin